MSSSAHVALRRCFVSAETSLRASIRAHGVWAVSYTLVMLLPVLTLCTSFWLGRNQFTSKLDESRHGPDTLYFSRQLIALRLVARATNPVGKREATV